MSDRNQRIKRVALRLIGHPLVVAPAAVGMGAVILSLLGGIGGGILTFAGIVAILSALGVSLYRFLFKRDAVIQAFIEEEAQQRQLELDKLEIKRHTLEQEKQRDLERLRNRLTQDDDTRDEELFERLCRINSGFSAREVWYSALSPIVQDRVRETFQNLFDDAIARLTSSVDLRDQSSRLQSTALEPLREARETLLKNVEEIVEHMGNVLGGIQALGIRSIADQALSHGDAKEQMRALDAILIGAQTAHESFSPAAKERKQEALRQRIRTARDAERSALESETTSSGEEKERA